MLSLNQFEEIKEQAYCGKPSQLPGVCLVYPLTISEIMAMGRNTYQGYLGTLLLSETDISALIKEKTGEESPIESINPLTYLLESTEQSDRYLLELQQIFSTFIKEEVLFLPKMKSIVVGSPKEKRLITPQNFGDFQTILKIQNKKEIKEPPPENESPGQRKMRLLREKVAAVKKKQAEKNNEGQSFLELLEIADTFGIDTMNCSLLKFYNLIKRYQMREKWDQDLQMLCAGADPKKMKTKYWGESSEEK